MEDTNNNQNIMSERQRKKARNNANNANVIRNAANVASKTANPYAKAIGLALNKAHKYSRGKSTELLAKTKTSVDRFIPGGRMVQAITNKMSESRVANKIVNSANKKDTSNSLKDSSIGNEMNNPLQDNIDDRPTGEGFVNFELSPKVIKMVLFVMPFALIILVFCNLFISATQVIGKAVGLDSADSVSNKDIEEKVNKKTKEDLNEELTEEEAGVVFNYFINDDILNFSKNKFNESNLIKTANKDEKYEDNILDDLEDFYPAINSVSKNYDERMVYDFFFKLYKLYHFYNDTYNVKLDMPLLMSTLQLQSTDMNVVFSSNLGEEDRKKTERESYPEFDYYYDWKGYITTEKKSTHDMAVLAQNMVSIAVNTGCVSDGKCYVIDKEKYNEFLKEFIEKKYYLDEENVLDGGYVSYSSSTSNSSKNYCTIKEFTKYDLTDDQVSQLASLAIKEQGTVKGAAAEASLMANLFELKGNKEKHGTGANGLVNYVRDSGWFANAPAHMASKSASDEVIQAVKSVLVDGKRTLPGYIDEHDCIVCYNNGTGDIISATNDGISISVSDKSLYKQNKTVLKNRYGSVYTFYSFPTEISDPFGYTSEKNRERIGDFYYDFETGEPVNCEIAGEDGNYVDGLSFTNSNFGKIYYYNQNDYEKYYYSTDPQNYLQFADATISSHGCGPTSLAIVASSIFDKEITPIETTAKVCELGGCTAGGSYSGGLVSAGKFYNMKISETHKNQDVLDALGTNNSLVIVLMGPGTFTTSGHFIVLTGMNSDGQVSVADPFSRNLTEKKWFSFNSIIEQRKTTSPYMIFSR